MGNKKLKILAIDDNPDNLITITALIFEAFPDAFISTALSGNIGLQLAKEQDPDVILLDIVMPEMDGYDVCKQLKTDKKLCDIPVVFITAIKGDKESRIRGLEVGAEAFLSKPIDETELTAQIRAMVKIKSANIERHNEKERLAALVIEKTLELKENHVATLNLLDDLKNENLAREKSEQALRESEEKYRVMTENSSDIIWHLDKNFICDYISPADERMRGYKKDEVIGTSLWSMLMPHSVELLKKANAERIAEHKKGIDTGKAIYELEQKCKDGSTVWTETSTIPQIAINGEIVGYHGVTRDITDRKRAQEALHDSEKKYRLITEKISDVVWLMDLNGKSIFVSQSVEDFSGYTVDEYLNQTIYDRFTPECQKIAIDALSSEVAYFNKIKHHSVDYRKMLILDYICKDGSVKTGEVLISPYLDENDNLIAIHGVTRDFTERKKAEKALRESEEKYREMTDLLPQIVYETDDQGNITYLNKLAHSICGYSEDENMLGINMLNFFIDEDKPRIINNFRQKISGQTLDDKGFTLVRKDGSTFPSMIYSSPIIKDNITVGVRGIIVDITEQKHAEDKLRESESKFFDLYSLMRSMSDTMSDMMWAKNLNNEYIFSNEAFSKRILNAVDTQEPIGKTDIFFALRERNSHSDDPKWHTFGEICADTDVIILQNMKLMQFEESGNVKGKFIFLDVIKAPLYNDKGELIGVVGSARDSTDRKIAEQKIIASELFLKETQKIARLGTYSLSFENNKWTSSDLLNEIFGISDDFDKSISGWLSIIHPAWRNTMSNYFTDEIVGKKSKFDKVYQIIRQSNQEVRWVHGIGELQIDKNNQIVNMIGSIHDITEITLIQEALRESEQKYREMADLLPQIVFETDVEGNLTYINKQIYKLCGYNENDNLIGKDTMDFYVDNDKKQYKRNRNKRLAGEDIGYADYRMLRKDGTTFPVLTYSSRIIKDDVVVGLRGVVVDISEQKLIQQDLEQSRNELKAIYENAPVMMCVVNEDTNIIFANYAFKTFSDMSENDFKDGQFGDVVSCIGALEDHRGCGYGKNCSVCTLRNAIKTTLKTGVGNREIEYQTSTVQNGIKRGVSLVCSTALINNSGRKNLLLCLHDITARKKAEEALIVSEQYTSSILAAIPDLMFVLDADGFYLDFISGSESNLEMYKENLIGKNLFEILPVTTALEIKEGVETVLNKEHAKIIEYELPGKNGLHAYECKIYAFGDDKVIAMVRDISERKEAAEALQKSERFLRTFIENTPFEIWARDTDNIGILENKKMVDHFGSILGKTPASFSNKEPEVIKMWESNNKRAFKGEMIDETAEYELNNHFFKYQQIIFPIYNNGIIIGIAGFNIDITERVRIEKELKESQSLYYSFIELLPNAVFRKNREGQYLLVNSQFCKLKGITKEEAIGRKPLNVLISKNANHGNNGLDSIYPSIGENLHELILQTGESYETEEEYDLPEGRKLYMHVVRMPVLDFSGTVIGSQGIMFDITERKQVEEALNISQDKLKQFAAHLQSIREEERTDLAREIHDDLGQILIALKIDLGLMRQKVLKMVDGELLEVISTNFDNLFGLVDNTIKTTRRIMTGLRPEVLELLGLVEATRLYTNDFKERHKISCKFDCSVSMLKINSQQSVALYRILQEGLSNVVRHSKASEVIVKLITQPNKLIMEISDNGIGFDELHKGRSDSYGMIGMKERVFLLEGELFITSKPGDGTTVRIEMPYLESV